MVVAVVVVEGGRTEKEGRVKILMERKEEVQSIHAGHEKEEDREGGGGKKESARLSAGI